MNIVKKEMMVAIWTKFCMMNEGNKKRGDYICSDDGNIGCRSSDSKRGFKNI